MSKVIGESAQPLLCIPLVATTEELIVAEVSSVLEKKPDMLEWRADFFADIAQTSAVIALTNKIKMLAGDTPMIFTIRSLQEGGQPIALSASEVIELNAAICAETAVEYVDCELSNLPADIQYLRKVAQQHDTKMIASYHNFTATPAQDRIMQKFRQAEQYGADVAKVAVMPETLHDVLTLLSATLEAKNSLNIPVITMSMGEMGAVTRMFGGVFGSAVSFAVGQSSSAPGQVPIEDLKTVFHLMNKARSCNNA